MFIWHCLLDVRSLGYSHRLYAYAHCILFLRVLGSVDPYFQRVYWAVQTLFRLILEEQSDLVLHLGDYCIQKFSFGEVYRPIYGRKFSFTATRKRSLSYIPPQMKILIMVIPILMHFCSFVSNRSVESK